jgi:PhnB protein
MLVTHIIIKGKCREAIELYEKALNASVMNIIPKPGQEELVLHAEILLHNQTLYLNDYGDNDVNFESGGYQLAVSFDSEDDLKRAYSDMKDGSITITPIQAADYSSCIVRFIDKFDVRWGFWVN